ncbi:anti-sigma factor [Cellulomonas humilata]|uniref:Regulator of SigK n=1 Tax=Cellulomonas humilata TaxID=144055 RepID=A0A7Y6A3W7_9CELL|nr:anti-sigma factor [Cellulomonas humilata]NUU19246.1 anti-sigma factor [Cellulomonas humilata]
MTISDDDPRSLLGAYALDAVDPDERAVVEQLVASDPEAAAELAQLAAVAATLGDAVAGEPPAALRASVLAAIADVPQLGPLAGPRHAVADAPAGPPSASDGVPASPEGPASSDAQTPGVTNLADRRRPSRTRWLAVAAAVVIGAAVPTALAVQQAQRANEAEQQQQALADLLTDPSAVVVHGDVTGGGTATAILTDDRALFSATGLPDPGDDKAYQLWVVDADGAASAGVMADDAGSVRQLADDFTAGSALAITIEPAAGSTQPTTDPLVVLSTT